MGSRHFAAIVEAVPHCYHGGGGVTAYAAVRAMLEAGNKVSVLVLNSSPFNGDKSEREHIQHLEYLGARVEMLGGNPANPGRGIIRRMLMKDEDLFPGCLFRARVKDSLERSRPDAIFMYHWNALAAAHGFHVAPKLGAVGDPADLPRLFRQKFAGGYSEGGTFISVIKSLRDKLVTPRLIKLMRSFLLGCDVCGAFAAHHAEIFKEMGVQNCQYFRTPIPDPAIQRRPIRKGDKLKILHIGHLQGIATLTGVELLAKEILPHLRRILPLGRFAIHIVGGFFEALPRALKRLLDDPSVKIRGQINPPDEEFLSSHVVLVPTPIELGIRVRILTAFSYGTCVVAHEANKRGIPELEHGVNCLLGSDGKGLAELCASVYRDPERRHRIETNGRKTYETWFSMESAGGAICEALSNLTRIEGRPLWVEQHL